ncbi:triose-phosphate isomerase [Candidatus Saccharibacteria bacterium]|nr:triose-phosphate isomerase [Candidatus Saccharibacteria bacterium]
MKKYIIGNWKMNLNVHEASLFATKLSQGLPIRRDVETVVCPSFVALQPLSLQVDHRQMKLGAQDCYWRDSGAFTGEVAATQLRGLAQYVLVGHSERRHIFGEHDRDIRFKVQAALRNGLTPVLCVGETELERKEGDTAHVLEDQIVSGLMNVGSDQIDQVLVTYEPLWTISTSGSPHVPQQHELEQVVKIIRSKVTHMFGREAGKAIPVLYGGSVDKDNARIFLSVEGIDGALVGAKSLIAPEFISIVEIASEIAKEEKK